ncbi:MAG: M48 family metallopeptidase [Victivallaceae bacterium]|nr:M48 family metallopeptidase [Victivallaceae bacterium]
MNRLVKYGTRNIEYSVKVCELANHYVEVSANEGVVLKGPKVSGSKADKLILMRSGWIIEKLQSVADGIDQFVGEIATGSRIIYLGRRYFAEVKSVDRGYYKIARVLFKYSKFEIIGNTNIAKFQDSALAGLKRFYMEKAKEKLPKRFKYWQKITGLRPFKVHYKRLDKRWGSCSLGDEISINVDVMKLPMKVVDYIILHELCHIEHKNHSNEFWNLLKGYMTEYQAIHDELGEMKV